MSQKLTPTDERNAKLLGVLRVFASEMEKWKRDALSASLVEGTPEWMKVQQTRGEAIGELCFQAIRFFPEAGEMPRAVEAMGKQLGFSMEFTEVHQGSVLKQ